jgi:hypothetical protein
VVVRRPRLGPLAEAVVQEVSNEQKLDEAVRRLRGNSDYEQIIVSLVELRETIQDELVLSKDSNDVLRAQGAVRLMKILMQSLAP